MIPTAGPVPHSARGSTRTTVSTQGSQRHPRVEAVHPGEQSLCAFPFHLYWDSSGANVQDMGLQKLPLGYGSAKLVTVKYPNGGYTPGDTWDLYVGSDNRFKEMVYHR